MRKIKQINFQETKLYLKKIPSDNSCSPKVHKIDAFLYFLSQGIHFLFFCKKIFSKTLTEEESTNGLSVLMKKELNVRVI